MRRLARFCIVVGAVGGSLLACNALVGWDQLELVGPPSRDAPELEDDAAVVIKPGKNDGSTNPGAEPFCDTRQGWGAPELVPELNTTKMARDAIVSPDGLEAYFVTGNGPALDFLIRRTTRATRKDKWGALTTIVGTPQAYSNLSMAKSGTRLYYKACDAAKCQFMVMTRLATDVPFSGPGEVFVPEKEAFIDLFVVASDDVGFFTKLVPDAGNRKAIFSAPINSRGVLFLSRQELPNLQISPAGEARPVLSESQTALYFSSNATGTSGDVDIWVSRRKSKGDPFPRPTVVQELSAVGTEQPSWVSNDDCEIFLNKADHVYSARRPPP